MVVGARQGHVSLCCWRGGGAARAFASPARRRMLSTGMSGVVLRLCERQLGNGEQRTHWHTLHLCCCGWQPSRSTRACARPMHCAASVAK